MQEVAGKIMQIENEMLEDSELKLWYDEEYDVLNAKFPLDSIAKVLENVEKYKKMGHRTSFMGKVVFKDVTTFPNSGSIRYLFVH